MIIWIILTYSQIKNETPWKKENKKYETDCSEAFVKDKTDSSEILCNYMSHTWNQRVKIAQRVKMAPKKLKLKKSITIQYSNDTKHNNDSIHIILVTCREKLMPSIKINCKRENVKITYKKPYKGGVDKAHKASKNKME